MVDPKIAATPAKCASVRAKLSIALGCAISWRVLGLLFAFALSARLAHVFAMAQSPYFNLPVVDAGTFAELGWSIARGHGHPENVFWHPPGYPYFLGAIWRLAGDSYLAPRLAQAFLGALNVVFIAWIGARHFGRGVGLGSGVAAALYAMLIYFDAELLAPTLAMFALLTTVIVAMLAKQWNRRALWLVAGAMGGLAATVVATSLIIPAIVAGLARRRAPLVVLGAALAIAPVTSRNFVRGHELVLISSNGGINFWIGNNPKYEEMVSIRPDVQWKRLVEEPSRAGVRGDAASSRYFARKALAWALAEPWAFVRLQLHKLRLLVSGNEIYRNQAIYPARVDSPILALLLWKIPGLAFPFGLLLPLALVGLAVGARRAPLLALSVAGLSVMVLAFFVTARYRVMLVPFLLIFAAQGVCWFMGEPCRRAKVMAGACVLAVYPLANWGQGKMEYRMNPDAEYTLGVRCGETGRMSDAQALFESAVVSQPGYVEAWLNLSVCYDAAGRAQDARAAFARAFFLDRDAVLTMVGRFMRDGKADAATRLVGHLRDLAAASPATIGN